MTGANHTRVCSLGAGLGCRAELGLCKTSAQVFHFNLNLGVPDAAGLDLGHSCWLLSHIPKGYLGWEGFLLKHALKSLAPLNGLHALEMPAPRGIWASGAG